MIYLTFLSSVKIVLGPERAAIRKDLDLQADIISIFEAELRRFVASAPSFDAAALDTALFEDLSGTMILLGAADCMEPSLAGRAYTSPASIELVMAVIDCLDRLLPELPAQTRQSIYASYCQANVDAAHVVEIAFQNGRPPQPPLTSSIPALRAVQWEAGVLIKLLNGPMANQTGHAGLAAESFCRILNTIEFTCGNASGRIESMGGAPQALPGPLITAVLNAGEAVARAVFRLPAFQPGMDTGPSVAHVIKQSEQVLLLFMDRAIHGMPKAKPISASELEAAEGLMGTVVKTTLLLAGPGALAAAHSRMFLPAHLEFLQYQVVASGGAITAVLDALLHQAFDKSSVLSAAALRCDGMHPSLLGWILATSVVYE